MDKGAGRTFEFLQHALNSARAAAAGHLDIEFVMMVRHCDESEPRSVYGWGRRGVLCQGYGLCAVKQVVYSSR